jgi:hypothetical protein
MPGSEKGKRRVYALVYLDDSGEERSIWYQSRTKAEQAASHLMRACRVQEVRL